MRTSARRERVAETIRKEVAGILRFDLADPRLGRATVTRVALTGDLTLARVYVSVLGSPEERRETLDALDGARGRGAKASRVEGPPPEHPRGAFRLRSIRGVLHTAGADPGTGTGGAGRFRP